MDTPVIAPPTLNMTTIDVHAPLFKIFETIEQMNYTRPYTVLDKPECYVYSP